MKYEKCTHSLRNLKGRDMLEDMGVYGSVILKWIFKVKGLVKGFCEHDNESSGFINNSMKLSPF
jgi:hypothetical protein